MQSAVSIAVVNAFARIMIAVLVGCFAVAITALANTMIGKFILIGISGWIAVNIFGFELSSVKDMSEVIANDPHYVVELALDAFL
ncbi:hypothetical protein N9W43_07565 [Litoricolaceae bacterium]|nr:hypothetical protein [Litorivicinaceae bacterium]MDB2425640.1 hypothetical protein [Litorivicinaceae bacterium]MDB2619044.1 hypothetical protein [Litorivicinaceae bacterium]